MKSTAKKRPVPTVGKYIDAEEKALIELIESGKFETESIMTPALKKKYMRSAQTTMNEARTKISLRLAQTDLVKLKAQAMREGMPYQTLIGSILHKAVSR